MIFDLGGVVLDSPMHVITEYEVEHDIAKGAINASVVTAGPRGAWACHERGELDRDGFLVAFADELRSHGMEVDTGALMARIEASFTERPEMVRAIAEIRASGRSVAAITNNWSPFEPHSVPRLFDVFVESVSEGVRKPEAEIYRRCLERLAVPARRIVMLDDLGPNLKPARDLGMATIKVVSAAQALDELWALLEMPPF